MPADRLTKAVIRSFLRCYLVGANFNPRGMQNIGLVYAMLPGLAAIHEDPARFRQAVKRYVRHYNSHPFWAPCLVGIFLSTEQRIAAGAFPPAMLEKVKDRTTYTLSAIGDSVFAGSLLIYWALSTACLLLAGHAAAAFAEGLVFFIGLQVFKVYTFWRGLRGGFLFLESLKRWDLINWGQRIKYANAALLLWFWILVWPKPVAWQGWLAGMLGLAVTARLVQRFHLPRTIPAVALAALWALYPVVAESLGGWPF
ncbi:PTS system mannose/fructose/sorbose family transporter subunit IID [Desulfovibrio aminophilus]|nr:PTS system mannose/fructose/sorbose family transporter subunit IID [Desulfovibrio aminophilus]MCM0754700.1 PTS system mannose/fructose/sorbose family transporter subunit IID [Desulfovibrio aminophilus]